MAIIKTYTLTLKDYKKIRTPFVFFDETGSINDSSNRFFGLGMIKCMQPHYLDSSIRLIRQRNNYHDEIKWNRISRKNKQVLKIIIDEIFNTPGIKFSAIIINKDLVDFKTDFENDPNKAYQIFSETLLCKNIHDNEILTIIADYISTPHTIHYEVDIKHNINKSLNRLAIGGVHRVDSIGVNFIQIVDLLLGSVVYEYKMKNKIVNGDKNKIEIYKHVQKKLEIDSFIGGVNKTNFKLIEHN